MHMNTREINYIWPQQNCIIIAQTTIRAQISFFVIIIYTHFGRKGIKKVIELSQHKWSLKDRRA